MAACGGGDDGGDGGGTAGAPSSSPATLTALQSELFTSCALNATCHAGATPISALSFDAPLHPKIVGRTAVAAPGRILVVAGDPSASYLVEKITANVPAAGSRMPLGGSPVPAATVERLRSWIVAGALDN